MNPKEHIGKIIEIALAEGASDIHLSVGMSPTIRISGNLVPILHEKPLTAEETAAILKEISPESRAELFRVNQSIDFAYTYLTKARFRVNGYLSLGSVGLAMRLIPPNIHTLAELGLPPLLEVFAQRQQGFFLVVGPTGQGKSTTLASLIEKINETRAEHILTIEDPIEYVFTPNKSMIHQREVRIDAPDFHTALEASFREDVDVIMVGEMRDPETVSSAVTAAETGHLVFSTLHTNDAAQTIDRIIDIFPAGQQDQVRVQLAGSLAGIFSQRLIPRISGGLIPAYELLINNNAVSNLIRERRTHEISSVIQTSAQEGMMDMDRSLAELVRRGEITAEHAYEHSFDRKTFERYL